MAESEAQHRRGIENKVVDGQFSEARFGQVFAFLITMGFLAGGIYLASKGQPTTGLIFGGIGIGGIVSTFILGRAKKKEDSKPPQQPPNVVKKRRR